MVHFDLFTGIGAFPYVADQVKWRVVGIAENDPNCDAVLKKNFPFLPNYGDVRNINGEGLRDWYGVDVITGGFPCTDLSYAAYGSKQGLEGEDSEVFYEMARVVFETDPKWVVIENVPQVTKYIDEIQKEMPCHEWDAKIFEARQFGAKCRRKRAFIIGCTEPGSASAVLDYAEKQRQAIPPGGTQDVFPMCVPWKGGVSLERLGSCVVEDTQADPTRIRKSDGVSRRMDGHRYLMLGNSIPPAMIKPIFEGIDTLQTTQ